MGASQKSRFDNARKKAIGQRFTHNTYGDYIIADYRGSEDVDVKFERTGSISTTSMSNARRGNVRDRIHPVIHGVGYIGNGKHLSVNQDGSPSQAYVSWINMISRCYDGKIKSYADVSVCIEWHNFQNFADWFYENYKPCSQMDKDIRDKKSKLYSPDTCSFVSQKDNVNYEHYLNAIDKISDEISEKTSIPKCEVVKIVSEINILNRLIRKAYRI